MATYWTPFVELVIGTAIYISGDALGAKASFPNVPEHGTIMSVVLVDRDSEDVNTDIVLFSRDIAGTADHDPFDPADAELQDCVGAILIDTFKAFSDNSIRLTDNVGLPYWAPEKILYFQCVTRGTPTYTATSDVRVAIGILY